MSEPVVPITIFSDFTCPYSYVAEGVWWSAPRSRLSISARAFQLVPAGQIAGAADYDWAKVEELSRGTGLRIHPRTFVANTAKAHESAFFARQLGREPELRLAIFEAYWAAGKDIGRIDVLVQVAASVGLDGGDLKIALDIDRFSEQVQRDVALGRRLRVPGTPTIYIGEGVSARVIVGARSANQFGELIEQILQP
jgi:predicted DsbA family dithiol-disulfide isomerase